jgi:hypothetical protein
MNVFNSSHAPIETKSISGGTQHVYRFGNDFGASVVRHSFSYGHHAGLWELAVLRFEGSDWHLTYDTDITDDVIGHLSESDVAELLDRIAALDKATA